MLKGRHMNYFDIHQTGQFINPFKEPDLHTSESDWQIARQLVPGMMSYIFGPETETEPLQVWLKKRLVREGLEVLIIMLRKRLLSPDYLPSVQMHIDPENGKGRSCTEQIEQMCQDKPIEQKKRILSPAVYLMKRLINEAAERPNTFFGTQKISLNDPRVHEVIAAVALSIIQIQSTATIFTQEITGASEDAVNKITSVLHNSN